MRYKLYDNVDCHWDRTSWETHPHESDIISRHFNHKTDANVRDLQKMCEQACELNSDCASYTTVDYGDYFGCYIKKKLDHETIEGYPYNGLVCYEMFNFPNPKQQDPNYQTHLKLDNGDVCDSKKAFFFENPRFEWPVESGGYTGLVLGQQEDRLNNFRNRAPRIGPDKISASRPCREVVQGTLECRDLFDACPSYSQNGWCTSFGGGFTDWMNENCKKSCGICHSTGI